MISARPLLLIPTSDSDFRSLVPMSIDIRKNAAQRHCTHGKLARSLAAVVFAPDGVAVGS